MRPAAARRTGAANLRALLGGAALPQSEAELLLAHALGVDRAGLLGADDSALTGAARETFGRLAARRARGEPMAYLLGRREFWSLPLKVTPDVLVPRPETELLVEWALQLVQPGSKAAILDLGTGSGCIALALAKERSDARVTAIDASAAALAVARENARMAGIPNVEFAQSSFEAVLASRLGPFDVIVANPPYVADGDPHLADLGFEPAVALTAGPDGLSDLRTIIGGAPARLKPGGWLLVEHGSEQGAAVRALLEASGFAGIATRRDLAGLERSTGGRHE